MPSVYAHIYLANDGEITCQDRVGFAAIGIGTSHAESEFMFAGHNVNNFFPETVRTAYFAKRRAEVAPGVGKATDMFMITNLGKYAEIGEHVLDALKDMHAEYEAKIAEAKTDAHDRMEEFNKELSQKSHAAGAAMQSTAQKLLDPP